MVTQTGEAEIHEHGEKVQGAVGNEPSNTEATQRHLPQLLRIVGGVSSENPQSRRNVSDTSKDVCT